MGHEKGAFWNWKTNATQISIMISWNETPQFGVSLASVNISAPGYLFFLGNFFPSPLSVNLLLSNSALIFFIFLSEGQQWLPQFGRVAQTGGLQRASSLQLRKRGGCPGAVWSGHPSSVQSCLTGAEKPCTWQRYWHKQDDSARSRKLHVARSVLQSDYMCDILSGKNLLSSWFPNYLKYTVLYV